MLNFNQKIKSVAVYIVLVSYLVIITINALHYHKFDLEKSQSILNPSDKNQNVHFYLNGAADFCPVQTAYNALQNSVISFSNPYQHYEKKIVIAEILIVSPKPLKSYILHYSLRAPPQIS